MDFSKKIIDIDDKFTFSNVQSIEKITKEKEEKIIEEEFLDEKISEEYLEILSKNIFDNLSIDYSKLNSIEEESAKEVLKAMNANFFLSNDKKQKLFILSEIIVPLYLKKIHKDIEWVWWNQCFNFDGKPKVPARGLDCGFILNNDFIYAEIKSSLHKDSYKTQIEKGIKKISELKNDESLISIERNISHYISKERYENINFNSNKFIIGFLNWKINKKIDEIDIDENLNSSSISFFEIKVIEDE